MSVLKRYNAAAGVWQAVGGMGLPQTPVGFSAHRNSVDFSYGSTAWAYVKLHMTTVEWNIGSYFDLTNSRFTPKVAGNYLVSANVCFKDVPDTKFVELMIYKNGIIYRDASTTCGAPTGWIDLSLPVIVPMNGSTDYVEVYVRCGQASIVINGDKAYSGFQATLIPDSYDSTKQIIDLTSATSDYLLGVGETVKITYASATSIPLHVATSEGVYELFIVGDVTAAVHDGWTSLTPNTAGISTFYSDIFGQQNGGTPSGTTSTGESILVQDGALVSTRGIAHTYTASKSAEFSGFGRLTSYRQRRSVFAYCTDTTTAWTSLGTITFPVAQSGTVTIRRII